MKSKIDVSVLHLDLDLMPNEDGQIIQKYLQQTTGQRTVPNIFIGEYRRYRLLNGENSLLL